MIALVNTLPCAISFFKRTHPSQIIQRIVVIVMASSFLLLLSVGALTVVMRFCWGGSTAVFHCWSRLADRIAPSRCPELGEDELGWCRGTTRRLGG